LIGDHESPFSVLEEGMKSDVWTSSTANRRAFIGGSDARIIMGEDEAALLRLWREKRGEAVRAQLKPASITIDYFPRFSSRAFEAAPRGHRRSGR